MENNAYTKKNIANFESVSSIFKVYLGCITVGIHFRGHTIYKFLKYHENCLPEKAKDTERTFQTNNVTRNACTGIETDMGHSIKSSLEPLDEHRKMGSNPHHFNEKKMFDNSSRLSPLLLKLAYFYLGYKRYYCLYWIVFYVNSVGLLLSIYKYIPQASSKKEVRIRCMKRVTKESKQNDNDTYKTKDY